MKKKFKNITAWNIIWFLIYIFPFIYIVFGSIAISNSSSITIPDYWQELIYDFFDGPMSFSGDPIYNAVYGMINYISPITPDICFCLACLIEWVILVSIVRIGVDVILMLPNIVHNFIDKIGGERE